ncbi:MAG: LysR family transcriptional regulator [Pseudobdellovibrionaceae bacterium]
MQLSKALPNLNHLKYFTDAVELGSVSAAADKNLVTHPAISRAISALENHLGVELLTHKKKSFEVTPTGFLVARKAKALLDATHTFQTGNLEGLETVTGSVSIGISRTLGQAYLSSILKNLASQFPRVQVQIRFGTAGEIVEKLAQNSLDLGLTIGYQPMATLKQTRMRKGQFHLVRASGKSKSSKTDLSSENFILTEPRAETELLKKQFYRQFKTHLRIGHEVGSWDMITQLVADGLGVGLIPDIALTSDRQKSLTPIKTDWFQSPYEIYLHQSKSALSTVACRALTKIIEAHLKV